MTEYAVRLQDLDRVGRKASCAALVEAVITGNDEKPEIVTVERSDAVVLVSTDTAQSKLIEGLLAEGVCVYKRDRRGAPWGVTDAAPVIEEVEEDKAEVLAVRPDDWPRIDAEFATLCGMLTSEEMEGLRASIHEQGCREKLVVWADTDILLDGHNRLAICRELGRSFEVIEYSFKDRDRARNWIIDNALARRNLTPQQAAYLRGKRLLTQAQDRTANLKNGAILPKGQSGPSGRTRDRVASTSCVSPRTIERDAAYAKAVDRIADSAGQKTRAAILSGEVKLTRSQVLLAAEREPRNVAQLLEVKAARPPASDLTASPIANVTTLSCRLGSAIHLASDSITATEPEALWKLLETLQTMRETLRRTAAREVTA